MMGTGTCGDPATNAHVHHVHCPGCGAILGYLDGKNTLVVYAYPPKAVRAGLETKRIAARITQGEIFCQYCARWRHWWGGDAYGIT